jgi:Mg-chelatase subunit ChlI
MHVKANGGTFVIDDLGRQRVEPYQLLNRWLFPLENRADYLTLQTGRKVCVPFRQMLVFSTNLNLEEALDGAFLRRIGYRLRIDNPTPPDYANVFVRYASRYQANIAPGLIEALSERYAAERRPMRSCEPRDLIERARDICTYRGLPLDLTPEVIDLAWKGYFGEQEDLRAHRAGSLA